MGKITVQYRLNKQGQKADLKAGGDGRADQVYEVDASDPELRDKIIKMGNIDHNGNVRLLVECSPSVLLGQRPVIVNRCYTTFNHPYRKVVDENVRRPHPDGQKEVGFSEPQDLTTLVAVAESLDKRRKEVQDEYVRLEAELQKEVEGEYEAAREAARKDEEKHRERIERRKAEKAARDQKAREDAEAWIREHGSTRLQLILKQGLLDDSMTVYREERLAHERPGWVFDKNWFDGEVDHDDIRNPSLDVLEWAIAVIEQYPDAELKFAVYDSDGVLYDPDDSIREPIMVDHFLDRTIVLTMGNSEV